MTAITGKTMNDGEGSSSALDAAIFARLQPTTYLSRFLENSIRPDGRSFDSFREVNIGYSTIETAQGSATVRWGNTTIIAGVKVEFLDTSDEPTTEDQQENIEVKVEKEIYSIGLGPIDRRCLTVAVDLTPMSSPKFRSGPPGEEAQILVSRLMRSLDTCPPLSASSLNIPKSNLRWCLYVDLICLSYDGNLLDPCLLAINAALHNTRLPRVEFDEKTNSISCSSDHSSGHSLRLLSCPVSFTFGIVEKRHLLSDPNAFESSMISGWITITLDSNKLGSDEELVGVQCSGYCIAVITNEEASQAGVQGTKLAESDHMLLQEEELIKVCLARAKKECKHNKSVMNSAQN